MKKRAFYFNLFIKSSFCFTLFCIASSEVNGQTATSLSVSNEIKITVDDINHKVDIAFDSDKIIYNLLVVVTDNAGRTIFLDNQYRFKGAYKQGIDLEKSGKGNYSIKIIKDSERVEKKLTLK